MIASVTVLAVTPGPVPFTHPAPLLSTCLLAAVVTVEALEAEPPISAIHQPDRLRPERLWPYRTHDDLRCLDSLMWFSSLQESSSPSGLDQMVTVWPERLIAVVLVPR